jgi:hypothetical protein
MRHLQLVQDHDAGPADFPPTWDDFQAARQRFFARLVAEADLAGVPAPDPEPPKDAVRP